MVAEGLKAASGREIVDELAPTDAFGHKRLAGAGKYVCQELIRRFEKDPEIPQLMKREKMYVKGLYEIPEVRAVSPGHLVRSGQTFAFDVNFGKEAGAAAVLLLLKGITGVTLVKVTTHQIKYMPTEQAIKPRYVSLDQVAFHEFMGVCFGRKPVPLQLEYLEVPGSSIERHL
jgi:6-phosphofructokinase 1